MTGRRTLGQQSYYMKHKQKLASGGSFLWGPTKKGYQRWKARRFFRLRSTCSHRAFFRKRESERKGKHRWRWWPSLEREPTLKACFSRSHNSKPRTTCADRDGTRWKVNLVGTCEGGKLAPARKIARVFWYLFSLAGKMENAFLLVFLFAVPGACSSRFCQKATTSTTVASSDCLQLHNDE